MMNVTKPQIARAQLEVRTPCPSLPRPVLPSPVVALALLMETVVRVHISDLFYPCLSFFLSAPLLPFCPFCLSLSRMFSLSFVRVNASTIFAGLHVADYDVRHVLRYASNELLGDVSVLSFFSALFSFPSPLCRPSSSSLIRRGRGMFFGDGVLPCTIDIAASCCHCLLQSTSKLWGAPECKNGSLAIAPEGRHHDWWRVRSSSFVSSSFLVPQLFT